MMEVDKWFWFAGAVSIMLISIGVTVYAGIGPALITVGSITLAILLLIFTVFFT